LPVTDVNVENALRSIADDSASGNPRVYVLVNAHSALLRRRVPSYAEAIFSPKATPLPDGASMTLGARVRARREIARCPGPDLLEAALSDDEVAGRRHFFVCATDAQSAALESALAERYPKVNLAGTIVPPMADVWPHEFTQAAVEAVRTSDAQIVWVGVSAPKQEVWAVQSVSEVHAPMVCVGAALDFITATKPRAPAAMRRMGLEWLYRLATEPKRLWHRYLVGNTVFLWDLLVKPPESESK
jgi:N-acetylglucosaminyldiphosphoundecaprenol N-acetyl-beta-D-mannosaminyltransferase